MKKILLFISAIVLSLCLTSCGGEKLSDFQSLVKCIYSSEEIIAGYNETNVIKDGNLEVYNKDVEFKIQRGEKVKSEVKIVEKKLSTSGTTMYDETITSYKTVDNVKYTEINGTTYENEYTMPTYYLTFVLSEEFLEPNYTFTREGNNYTLSGKVLDNKVSSLFLNKSVGSISGLLIEIVVNNGKLQSFEANYTSTTGFDVNISTSYLYAEVGKAKAVFYLEGGICQNSKNRVSYIYSFDGTKTDVLIVDPNVLETEPQDQIVKTGYHIEGWYRTKTTNSDGTVEYSDKWDFSKDKMTIAGVTLYAKWEIDRSYSYELYYIDKDGKEVFLDSYECNEGEKFYDLFMDNKTVEGYTSLGYLDENGKPWNANYKHPGGDADLAIKVYLNLIEGEYTVVKTAREFTRALSRNQNIYLTADIDLDGDEICYDSYSGTILGNGHTISNFEIDYDSSRGGLKGELDDINSSSDHLYISLFFELKDAVIKDINFSEFVIDVDTNYSQIKYLIVSPLAIKATNTKLENVKLSGNIEFTKTPDCEIEVIYDDFWFSASDDVIVDENSSVKIEE